MSTIFAALLTPFRADGALDLDAVPAHLRWLEAQGLDGVVPCGTTGEGPSLSLAERKAVIDTVIAHRGSLRVIAGTGSANLPETVEASRYALERGAEAVLVTPPFFFKGVSDQGLIAYFRALCNALPSDGKVVLYHIPPQTQLPIGVGVIEALLQSHPQMIAGVKDSGQDDDFTAMLCGHFPQLAIYDGTAPLLANCLADGAAGGIFALANLFPRQLRAIADAVAGNGDLDAAQSRIVAIEKVVRPPVPALKALLPRIAHLPMTYVRPPLVNVAPADADALWATLEPLLG